MKKSIVTFLIVLSALIFLINILTVNAASENYKIRFSSYWPPSHFLVKTADFLASCVKERTKGKLLIEVYPSGQLYSQKESLKAVAMGSVEMSDELMDKAEVIDPIFGVGLTNTYIITSYEMAWAFLDHPVYRKIIEEAFAKKLGVKPLMYMSSGTASLLTNSKRPVKKPGDVKGMLIRVSGKSSMDKIYAMGGKATIMSSGEQIMALQRGTVDGAWTSPGDGVSRKIWEVQKYATASQSIVITHPFLINLKFFNNLPPELQTELEACAQKSQSYGRKLLEEEEKGLLATLQSHMDLYRLTEEDSAEWEKCYAPLTEEWLKKTGENGKTLRDLMFKIRADVLARKK
jgi:C4-dicarboxylate-binding protein DctP